MATVQSTSLGLSLSQVAKLLAPDGSVQIAADLLSQNNEILEDVIFMPGNGPFSHRLAVQTGLPSVYTRTFNAGTPISASQFDNLDVSYSLYSAWSQVDRDEVELGGDEAGIRFQNDKGFIEALNQNLAYQLFYGSPANNKNQFPGFALAYGNNGSGNNAAQNIIDAGGTGAASNTSIWMVGWSDNTVFCPYPKGTAGGLQIYDHGLQQAFDNNNNLFMAYKTEFKWLAGLAIKDWRYVGRIANIAVNTANSQRIVANLIDMMSDMTIKPPKNGNVKYAFYCNKTVFAELKKQARKASQNALSIDVAQNQFGENRRWLYFDGIPIREVDQVLNTESQVTSTS